MIQKYNINRFYIVGVLFLLALLSLKSFFKSEFSYFIAFAILIVSALSFCVYVAEVSKNKSKSEIKTIDKLTNMFNDNN